MSPNDGEREQGNKMICERCNNKANISTGSIFNTQQICMPCKDKETAHPKYDEARKAEMRAVKNGDYNFPGIGKPSDL
jgi:hypothetical protein